VASSAGSPMRDRAEPPDQPPQVVVEAVAAARVSARVGVADGQSHAMRPPPTKPRQSVAKARRLPPLPYRFTQLRSLPIPPGAAHTRPHTHTPGGHLACLGHPCRPAVCPQAFSAAALAGLVGSRHCAALHRG
jgi:hypothetical protein